MDKIWGLVSAFGLALCLMASPAIAAADDGEKDFTQEVSEGLHAVIERPDLAVANEALHEQEAREEADRAERNRDEREREQAAQDRYQREEYERRNANPDGPF